MWARDAGPVRPGDVASRGGEHACSSADRAFRGQRHDPVIGLGVDQINRRFAAAARGLEDGAIVALAFCAGLRRSEIAALRWRDVAATERPGQLMVRVRASKTNPEGALCT